MKKVFYIGGTNRLAQFAQDLLGTDKVNIKGYVSAKDVYEKERFRGYPLISAEKLKHEEYDFFLICEEMEYDRSDKRNIALLECLSIMSMVISPEYYLLRKTMLREMKMDTMGVNTGMSYVQRGLIYENISVPFCMCAAPTQDLFYDFYTLADASAKMAGRLKYVIMGLAPYSLRYDLSLSKANQNRSLYYFREFKEWHNLKMEQSETDRMTYYDEVMDEYATSLWRDICFDILTDDPYHRVKDVFVFDKCDERKKEESLRTVHDLANKPYEASLEENKVIFEMYLKLCKKMDIRLIVLLPPFSIFFREHFPKNYIEEMRSIVRGFQKDYNFVFADMYEDPDFAEDKCYADVDHLNAYGAELLTRKVDALVEVA